MLQLTKRCHEGYKRTLTYHYTHTHTQAQEYQVIRMISGFIEHNIEEVPWFCTFVSFFAQWTSKISFSQIETESSWFSFLQHCSLELIPSWILSVHLWHVSYGCPKPGWTPPAPHNHPRSPPSVSSSFPELIFIPLIHAVGRSLYPRNVAMLQQKREDTHTHTLDSVQLFTQLNPDVLHNFLLHRDCL